MYHRWILVNTFGLRLFEQVPAPTLVIKVAEEATRKVDQGDPNCVSRYESVPVAV